MDRQAPRSGQADEEILTPVAQRAMPASPRTVRGVVAAVALTLRKHDKYDLARELVRFYSHDLPYCAPETGCAWERLCRWCTLKLPPPSRNGAPWTTIAAIVSDETDHRRVLAEDPAEAQEIIVELCSRGA